MRIPKRYENTQLAGCPFCDKQAITKNKQKVPVCVKHKEKVIDGWKCVCGSFLDILEGKWGPYCRCPKCGNMNFKKGLELNKDTVSTLPEKVQTKPHTIEEVDSHNPKYF